MKYKHAEEKELDEPEIVVNLWAYVADGGYITRVAGKTYILDGTDSEKLAVLRALAGSDFLCAQWRKVPSNFTVQSSDGVFEGVAPASVLSEPNSHSHLFGPLLEELNDAVPEQLQSIDGEYHKFKLHLPSSPLTVTTVVMEYEDGRLVPMVSR